MNEESPYLVAVGEYDVEGGCGTNPPFTSKWSGLELSSV